MRDIWASTVIGGLVTAIYLGCCYPFARIGGELNQAVSSLVAVGVVLLAVYFTEKFFLSWT